MSGTVSISSTYDGVWEYQSTDNIYWGSAEEVELELSRSPFSINRYSGPLQYDFTAGTIFATLSHNSNYAGTFTKNRAIVEDGNSFLGFADETKTSGSAVDITVHGEATVSSTLVPGARYAFTTSLVKSNEQVVGTAKDASTIILR